MIKPTPGRVVWYYPTIDDPPPIYPDEPLAALVARVISDREVNLMIIHALGSPYIRVGVQLVQEGDAVPAGGGYCTWMPYQIGQAAKAGGPAPQQK
jgi:hypothetical protein